MKMKVETIRQKNGKYVVSLIDGDLKVTKGIFPKAIDATSEAKRVADLYGCNRVLSTSPTCHTWS